MASKKKSLRGGRRVFFGFFPTGHTYLDKVSKGLHTRNYIQSALSSFKSAYIVPIFWCTPLHSRLWKQIAFESIERTVICLKTPSFNVAIIDFLFFLRGGGCLCVSYMQKLINNNAYTHQVVSVAPRTAELGINGELLMKLELIFHSVMCMTCMCTYLCIHNYLRHFLFEIFF